MTSSLMKRSLEFQKVTERTNVFPNLLMSNSDDVYHLDRDSQGPADS